MTGNNMAYSKPSLSNLKTAQNIGGEKDELYWNEKKDIYRRIKDIDNERPKLIGELARIQREENKAKGIVPAYVNTSDLIPILESVLQKGGPISKAFREHEQSSNQVNDWARRAITRVPNKDDLLEALRYLKETKNSELLLMDKYGVFDIKPIVIVSSYSGALNQIKRQLAIAKQLEQKDIQLLQKDKVIADKKMEITLLNKMLVAQSGVDKKKNSLEIKLLDPQMPIAKIAKLVGAGRTSISEHLHKPEIKVQWENKSHNNT
jgi:hypothetical protein